MKKSTKIIIGVSALLVAGAAITLIGRNKNKSTETEDNGGDNGSTNGGSGNVTIVYPSTGFSNKDEGNAFRAWVNAKYPSYAKSIDLDVSGAYDNSYIRKAYQKYGSEYKSMQNDPHRIVSNLLGEKATLSSDRTVVPFNEGKNKAVFYSNGRFSTHNMSGGGYLNKGNYTDGGRVLVVTEGKNKGESYNDIDVVKNLWKSLYSNWFTDLKDLF